MASSGVVRAEVGIISPAEARKLIETADADDRPIVPAETAENPAGGR